MRGVEIEPAGLMQVTRTERGKLVAITDDVQGVARDLRDFDRGLKLWFNPDQDYYVVYHVTMRDGEVKEDLVLTARELDPRVVQRVKQIAGTEYDFVKEMEQMDAAAERARQHAFSEQLGPRAERLAHAIRKDLGMKPRAFITRDLKGG
jgi:hypothetical protein